MNILIAADTYYPDHNGASYFTQRLAEGLAARGHVVWVIAPSTSLKTVTYDRNGVHVVTLFSLPTVFHKQYRFTPPLGIGGLIRQALATFQPDVVHIQGHFYVERTVAKQAAALGLPVIGTNHFMPENLMHYAPLPRAVQPLVKTMMWNDFKKVFQSLDLITTPTRAGAKILETIGLNKPVLPVSCGINLELFHATNDDLTPLFQKYHIPERPILLCVGRLSPEKNVDLILRALAQVTVDVQLVVVGGGMQQGPWEALAAELGIADRVTFTGYVPDEDLPKFYKIATAFVMAGEVELQSIVTMEAMACGLPVLAINKLALPELVHDGENGWLFEKDNPGQLAEQITKLFSDDALRARMSEASLKIIAPHAINHTFEKFEELYRKITAEAA